MKEESKNQRTVSKSENLPQFSDLNGFIYLNCIPKCLLILHLTEFIEIVIDFMTVSKLIQQSDIEYTIESIILTHYYSVLTYTDTPTHILILTYTYYIK